MKHVVMIGTGLATRGGIAAVVNVYASAGMFRRYPVRYIESHCDGSAFDKLAALLRGYARFLGMLFTGQVGVAHIHVASRASFWRKSLFFWPAWLLRVPVIMHLHGAEFSIFYEQECGPLRKALVRAVFDRAARVVVLSSAWKRWMQAVTRNPRVEAIYNPVQLPLDADWQQRVPGQVLFLGRLGARKGSYDLVGAASKIAPAQPGLRLLMGGDGEIDETQRHAHDLGIGSRVSTLGWVGAEQRAQLLSRAWMYALPSYNEGLPMSVLEAMAAGLPVLTTPVGGIPEAVTDGVEGFVVDPGDVDGMARRMAQLLSDATLARAMGAAARRKVETTFSAAAVLPRIERMYKDLGIAPL